MNKKISLISFIMLVLIILGKNNVFADIYYAPSDVVMIFSLPILAIIFVALCVILVISIICYLIGKILKSEDLVKKSISASERMFYYLLIIIAFVVATQFINLSMILGLILYIILILSVVFRIAKKKKKLGYAIIGSILVFMVLYILIY